MVSEQREFDIIVYGATGFVGKLAAEYLSRSAGQARIALAGRSAERLEVVRQSLGEPAQSWPIIIADAASPATLAEMAVRTRVVVTTVGPYAKYGLPLVQACAEAGTDYADLSGEPNFVRDSIDTCHKRAADTGARILHSCGFDSIPSDLTVFALHRRAQRDGAGDLLDTTFVVRAFAGGASGGTAASIVELIVASSKDPALRAELADPYTLTPDRAAEPDLGPQPDVRWRRGAGVAPELRGYWLAAFAMAMPNSRVVRRSNALLDYAYGRRLSYAELMSVRKSFAAPLAAALVTGANAATLALGSRFGKYLPRGLVDRVLPRPGTGPSAEQRDKGYYTVETYTTTTSGARYRARMSQQGDPGYKATAVLLAESALCLALDRDKLSDLHGVLTPAAAIGDALLDRLPAAGVVLEVDRLA